MKYFLPLRGTKLWVLIRQNLKLVNCQMSPVIINIFRPNTSKGTAKVPAVDHLRLNTLKGFESCVHALGLSFINMYDLFP